MCFVGTMVNRKILIESTDKEAKKGGRRQQRNWQFRGQWKWGGYCHCRMVKWARLRAWHYFWQMVTLEHQRFSDKIWFVIQSDSEEEEFYGFDRVCKQLIFLQFNAGCYNINFCISYQSFHVLLIRQRPGTKYQISSELSHQCVPNTHCKHRLLETYSFKRISNTLKGNVYFKRSSIWRGWKTSRFLQVIVFDSNIWTYTSCSSCK